METSQVLAHETYAIKPGWISVFLGFVFILIGIWVMVTPAKSYLVLSTIFSITFMVNGIFEIFSAVSSPKSSNNGWILSAGIFDLLLGIMLMSSFLITHHLFPFYVGFGLLFRSMMAISVSFQFNEIKEWESLRALGIGGLLLSFFLLFNLVFAEISIVTFTGLAFIIIGTFRLPLGLKLSS